jgi:hypothetical protein
MQVAQAKNQRRRSHIQAPSARKNRIVATLTLRAIDSIEAVTESAPSFTNIALEKTTKTAVQNIAVSVVENCSLTQ